MAADLALTAEVTGVDQIVSELGKVTDAERRIGDEAARAGDRGADGSRKLHDSSRTASASIGQMAGRIGSAASAVGSLSSALGSSAGSRAAGLLGSLAGAVTQGAALGATFGPHGALIGGMLGAVPVIASLTGAHTSAADAAREHRQALEGVASAARALREQEAMAGALRTGMGLQNFQTQALERERDVLTAELNQVKEEVRRFRERASQQGIRDEDLSFVASGGAFAGRDLLQVQADLEAQIGTAQGELIGRSRAASVTSRAEQGNVREPTARDRAAAAERARRAQEERDAAITRNLLGDATVGRAEGETLGTVDMQEQFERQRDATRELADAQMELDLAAREASDNFRTNWTGSLEEIREAWNEANRTSQVAGRGMISMGQLFTRSLVSSVKSVTDAVGNQLTSAFESSLDAWLDGSKSFEEAAEDMAKGVIKALTMEAIVTAVVEVARALSSFASQNYAEGLQHLAAAAAWGAVAGVAGGVGAATGAFGGGGEKSAGAGGADSRSLGAGSVREEAPTQNLTVNIYPGILSTRDEVSGAVMDAFDYAVRGGRRIDSRAVR